MPRQPANHWAVRSLVTLCSAHCLLRSVPDIRNVKSARAQIVHLPSLFAADDNAIKASRYDDVTISVYPLDSGGEHRSNADRV